MCVRERACVRPRVCVRARGRRLLTPPTVVDRAQDKSQLRLGASADLAHPGSRILCRPLRRLDAPSGFTLG